MKRAVIAILIVFLLMIGGILLFLSHRNQNSASGKTISIVAAENFYGNIAGQIGGNRVSVVSILSDPNVDPHEYESNIHDGIAISNADVVIENGDSYDTWMDKLLAASPNPKRAVLVGYALAPNKLEDNPHVWYGIGNIRAIASAIAQTLEQKDPSGSALYQQNLTRFDASLTPIEQKMQQIKSQYQNTPVGLTETIYLYQTGPMALNVLTPLSFERAIAEGNDPSVQDVALVNAQAQQKSIRVLIYNAQTVTPITTHLQSLAQTNSIPIVPVTETMPTNQTYQSWMLSELNTLNSALHNAGAN